MLHETAGFGCGAAADTDHGGSADADADVVAGIAGTAAGWEGLAPRVDAEKHHAVVAPVAWRLGKMAAC